MQRLEKAASRSSQLVIIPNGAFNIKPANGRFWGEKGVFESNPLLFAVVREDQRSELGLVFCRQFIHGAAGQPDEVFAGR